MSVECVCPHEDCGAWFQSHTDYGETTVCPECGRQQNAQAPKPYDRAVRVTKVPIAGWTHDQRAVLREIRRLIVAEIEAAVAAEREAIITMLGKKADELLGWAKDAADTEDEAFRWRTAAAQVRLLMDEVQKRGRA